MIYYIVCSDVLYALFFFFQAEDGIRVPLVTGVQTCALPISTARRNSASSTSRTPRTATTTAGSCRCGTAGTSTSGPATAAAAGRSEERRVGEGGSNGAATRGSKNY